MAFFNSGRLSHKLFVLKILFKLEKHLEKGRLLLIYLKFYFSSDYYIFYKVSIEVLYFVFSIFVI